MAFRGRSVWGGLLCLAVLTAPAAWGAEWDVQSDTWVAVDALGRKLPGAEECGPPRPDKVVAIFYFIWHGQHGTAGPFDISKILAENPENPAWGPEGAFHHWGEAEDGYYLPDDEYIIRKHSRELVNAGVDVVVFDVTNAFRYTPIYMKVCEVYRDLRAAGEKTPQICFLTHSSSVQVVQQLYDEFYAKNLYPELWFRWKGKPLILADLEGHSAEVNDFFTIRYSWAWDSGHLKWSWIDHYPQKIGYETPGEAEWIPVAVAQHPTTNIGRSFHDGAQPPPSEFKSDEGLCFAEQWRRALEVDPAIVFITGWNEWVAQRFISNGKQSFLGKVAPAGATFFVDQYNQEYSRDIEPMKGGHTDNYYYQMVANIRRFKGVREPERIESFHTIAVDGDFSDWDGVTPEYRDHVGDPVRRNHPGWGDAGPYVNDSGRNDFKVMKVALDADTAYFYARCRQPLTEPSGTAWMMLLINADEDATTGWEGYDLVVNREALGSDRATVERNRGGWNWEAVGEVPMRMNGDVLELAIPRTLLNGRLEFEFKWADNIPAKGDIVEFSTYGDAAPDRRFNYVVRTGGLE